MRRKHVPLTAIRAFEAVGRLGRQTLAGDELGVSHGAISRQLRHLEECLGVKLVEGTRGNPVLTPAGRTLSFALTPIFDDLDAAIRVTLEEEAGVLNVACLSTFAMRLLIPKLYRFQRAHPAIDVRLSTNNGYSALEPGRYDVSIIALDPATGAGPMDVMLFDEKIGIVLAASLAGTASLKQQSDIAQLPWLSTRTRPNAWSLWQEKVGLPPETAPLRPPIDFEHYSFAIEAAISGLGACAAPHHLVANELENRRLVAPFGFIGTGYRYVARKSSTKDRKSSQFCAWLEAELAIEA